MKVYAVRHGQSNYNVIKMINDDPSRDVHLTGLGRNQSRAVSEER